MAYEVLAEFYDTFMDDVDYEKWASFIIDILKKYGKPLSKDSTIIDLACGTGELTCKLGKGLDSSIIAVDISEEMLMKASEKASSEQINITFICKDMVKFKPYMKSDAIICTCDGINYIPKNKIKALFKNVYESLNDGCIFTFDISSAYKLKNLLGDNIIAEDRGNIAFIWENTLSENCVQIDLSIFKQIRGKQFIKEEEQQLQYIYYNEEIIDTLTKAGFKEVHTFEYGSFDQPGSTSERIQFAAIK